MKYLVYVEVTITKPKSDFRMLKFEVSAKSTKDAMNKVEHLHRTKGLMGKEYEYTPVTVGVKRGTYWEWNGHQFYTLAQAKACIEGDFNGVIKEYLEYDGYDKIAKLVNGIETSFVTISADEEGYAVFSKIEKISSNLPTLA